MTAIETIHFDSAQELIRFLRRSEPHWTHPDNWNCHWIFRGHRNADWELRPLAWRGDAQAEARARQLIVPDMKNAMLAVQSIMSHWKISDAIAERLVRQLYFEHWVVRQFVDGVDELGLPVPGRQLPKYYPFNSSEIAVTTDTSFPPAVALAQHHGMPTRLLDWTRNPLIAAFFAIDGVKQGEKGRAAIWALNLAKLGVDLDRQVSILTVPRSHIGFLHAQDALFTYAPNGNLGFVRTGTWPALEELIPTALQKITIAKKMAIELKRLLWVERVSKAHLMPTLDSVTGALNAVWNDLLGDGSPKPPSEG